MGKLKHYIQNSPYGQCSLFLCLTITALYLLYQTAHHLPTALAASFHFMAGLCSALSPLFIGFVIAYLLTPPVNRLEKKVPRCCAILITMVLLFSALFLLFYSLVMLLLGRIAFYSPGELMQQFIAYFNEYEQTISHILSHFPSNLLSDGLTTAVNEFLGQFAHKINGAAAMEFAKSMGSRILNIVLGIIVSFYLLNDRDFFLRLWRKSLHLLLPLKQSSHVKEFLWDVNVVISRFLRGQLVDAMIVALLSCIGLSLIHLEFAVFVGVFCGISNVIPYFGPIMGMIPAIIIGISTAGLKKALLAVLVLFLIQQVDSAVISPRVVGTSTGLHPVFVLLSVTVGGYYFGILGMLLAVPITAICKLFLLKWLHHLED